MVFKPFFIHFKLKALSPKVGGRFAISTKSPKSAFYANEPYPRCGKMHLFVIKQRRRRDAIEPCVCANTSCQLSVKMFTVGKNQSLQGCNIAVVSYFVCVCGGGQTGC